MDRPLAHDENPHVTTPAVHTGRLLQCETLPSNGPQTMGERPGKRQKDEAKGPNSGSLHSRWVAHPFPFPIGPTVPDDTIFQDGPNERPRKRRGGKGSMMQAVAPPAGVDMCGQGNWLGSLPQSGPHALGKASPHCHPEPSD
ncbi:uncharacterized protein N7482_007635 [Penicillium canariense]|uniref:Uncharacterized protein n=1 Tax=Penicillium canariense TaxID=189055 RepID=A0A9W9HZG5_9EURO|nr:uncharacterized protein N7482_007635 [Penicillium canariense]KAJ5160631.1 hypothetical protein N7482_007635 [Penicillium canariense]